MENFPSNSHVSKRESKVEKIEKIEDKRILKVVKGDVIRRKKPLGTRFVEAFFGGDGKGAMDYVVDDVLLPALKDMVTDAVSEGVQRLIRGDSRPPSRHTTSRPSSHVNYGGYSDRNGRREEPRRSDRRTRSSRRIEQIILSSRDEAEDTLAEMFNTLERYGSVSVSELYEMVGIEGTHVDDAWGWTDLYDAGVRRLNRDQWLIKLPDPEPLRNSK